MAMLRFVLTLILSGFVAAARRMRRGRRRPTWTFAQEGLVEGMRRYGARSMALPPIEARARWDGLLAPPRRSDRVSARGGKSPAPNITVLAPKELDRVDVCIMHIHGGAYVFGSAQTNARFLHRMARAALARIYAVDYRLAPEHPFPAAVDDALSAYRAVLASGVDPAKLVLMGDSSGGALVLTTLVLARDAGLPLPAGAVVMSPWVDLTSSSASATAEHPDDWGDAAYLRHWADVALAGASPEDPRASPLRADLAGLPPLLVQVGSAELLHDEVVALAEKARSSGVDVTLSVYPDMVHGFPLLADSFPLGVKAIDEAATFVRSRASAAP